MQTVSHGTSSYQEKADGAILATGQKKSFFNKSLMNSNYISQFVDRWAGWQKALIVQIEPRRKIKGYACWVRGTMTGEWGDILFPWMLSSCCLILCAKCFFFFFYWPNYRQQVHNLAIYTSKISYLVSLEISYYIGRADNCFSFTCQVQHRTLTDGR